MSKTSPFADPLLTDLYEFTMAYAYFQSGRHQINAAFDLFFRKNPFGGEFTIFAGLAEAVEFLRHYRWTNEQIEFLCTQVPECSEEFRGWLRDLDSSPVRLYAVPEGTVVFPGTPLLRVEGPLGLVQMMESALLNLVAYPSLVATNAARMRLAAGDDKQLVEFGLRRAQGPDGAVSASRYSYLGGFDGTSNVKASQLFGIPSSGTQAHAYIQSYRDLDEIQDPMLADPDGSEHDIRKLAVEFRERINGDHANDGELASFIAYAQAFPSGFLALVDTYDTLKSGVPNFLAVALALKKIGYQPVGIRLDSGDLAHLSKVSRHMFSEAGKRVGIDLGEVKIVASNEINEPTLRSLTQQGHEIDIFGVGTHLVTCQAQPSLGCVYKLVELGEIPRIKISQEPSKTTIPGRKVAYRLYGEKGYPLADLMIRVGDEAPKAGERILCCHPWDETKRTYVVPACVDRLHHLVWDGSEALEVTPLEAARERAGQQIKGMREDHLRLMNPTPYKVSLSQSLFEFTRELMLKQTPIGELR